MPGILTISEHAKERYAERIMRKDETLAVNQFIAEHSEKIEQDIKKMAEYGKCVYTGKLSGGKDRNSILDVYIKDTWVLLVDSETHNCVTLYKIDLGLDDDFNKKYVEGMVAKIKDAKEATDRAKAETDEQCGAYETIIEANEEQIKEYKGFISNLEAVNDSYKDLCRNLKISKNMADASVRELVDTLIGKPKY